MALETVPVTLATTLGADEWETTLPVDVAIQSLIAKLVRTPDFGLHEVDDEGLPVPYRLMWKEGSRYLRETETLRSAGVQGGNTLVVSFEARAGIRRHNG